MKGSPSSIVELVSMYEHQVALTNWIKGDDPTPIKLGLFGEVGSIMSTSKKRHREERAYVGFLRDMEEELGDVLWYIAALCSRQKISLAELFSEVCDGSDQNISIAREDDSNQTAAKEMNEVDLAQLDYLLLRLGEQTALLLGLKSNSRDAKQLLLEFVRVYIKVVQISPSLLNDILSENTKKVGSRFGKLVIPDSLDFDKDFPKDEQLPREFEIEIKERESGLSYLRWQGVFVGAPLKDAIGVEDGYRFHDVFHLAHAAVLHWSPTFRGLIKHKRKSNGEVAKAQDNGRAVVVEEGLAAYIFSHAKSLNYFEGQKKLSFDLLKAVQNFVRGYEVEQCPLSLWEKAILQGYNVFRQMREHKGGIVIGNREERTLHYESLGGQPDDNKENSKRHQRNEV